MKPIHLDVEHARTGERKRCEYVDSLASGGGRTRARARAVRVRWPNGAGLATFCLASGWELPAECWRLDGDSRRRARRVAELEGLRLPEPSGFPPRPFRSRATPPASEEQPIDPRQARLPF